MITMQPLRWPEGQKRTKINDRDHRKQWKKPISHYLGELETELKKLGAVGVVVTGDREAEKIDPGVVVYFSLPPKDATGDWQDVLGIDKPKPSEFEINDRVKELRARFHPENSRTGNLEVYLRVGQAQQEALAWTTGNFGARHERCIPCDRYNEVRLNIKGIKETIAALRRVEEVGAPGYLDRAFAGFAAPQLTEVSRGTVA